MPLKMTDTRLTVLRAIAAGQVKRHLRWGKGEKTRDVCRPQDRPEKTVTRTCNELTRAMPRLAVTGRSTGPSIYSPQVWELTEAGRAVLAAHDTKEADRG